MVKNPMTYYSSDWHLNHWNGYRGIISFERTQFKTIEEHDQYILNLAQEWAKKWAIGSTLWFLGDFGNIQYLWIFDVFRSMGHEVHFLYGNHDSLGDYDEIQRYVDYVHLYPVYLSQKLIVSHYPVAVYKDSINVCGHLHGAKLSDPNHLVASIHVADYKPITQKNLDSTFANLPKFNRRFLYEPYAEDYMFIQPKEDVIMDRDGRIDLSASRMLQRANIEVRKRKGDSYIPYNGEGEF